MVTFKNDGAMLACWDLSGQVLRVRASESDLVDTHKRVASDLQVGLPLRFVVNGQLLGSSKAIPFATTDLG